MTHVKDFSANWLDELSNDINEYARENNLKILNINWVKGYPNQALVIFDDLKEIN